MPSNASYRYFVEGKKTSYESGRPAEVECKDTFDGAGSLKEAGEYARGKRRAGFKVRFEKQRFTRGQWVKVRDITSY